MEGLVILGMIGGATAFLAYRAREKVRRGSYADMSAQADIPRRPASGGLGADWADPAMTSSTTGAAKRALVRGIDR